MFPEVGAVPEWLDAGSALLACVTITGPLAAPAISVEAAAIQTATNMRRNMIRAPKSE
jgi:hypothetical protein